MFCGSLGWFLKWSINALENSYTIQNKVHPLPCTWYNMYSYHFTNIFGINIYITNTFRFLMCVFVVFRSYNWHFRMITWFWIPIFIITNGLFKNIFSFNRFFNLIIVLIYWFCNDLNITNCFLIIPIRNSRSFYFFIHCSNICRKLSILLIDSLLYFSGTAVSSTYLSIVTTSTLYYTDTFTAAIGDSVLFLSGSSKWSTSWSAEAISPLLFI